MKKAGDLIPLILNNLNEDGLKKARTYSELFLSWTLLTEENGIAAAVDHSRIKELEGSVLLIEADHPGWIQILFAKRKTLLEGVRRRFPDISVTDIKFRLNQ
jgi:predicted nucleic acid-binding Zn ribbon protein